MHWSRQKLAILASERAVFRSVKRKVVCWSAKEGLIWNVEVARGRGAGTTVLAKRIRVEQGEVIVLSVQVDSALVCDECAYAWNDSNMESHKVGSKRNDAMLIRQGAVW